jgi:hypothetical protein
MASILLLVGLVMASNSSTDLGRRSFAIFAAIRRASSLLSSFAADCRPGSSFDLYGRSRSFSISSVSRRRLGDRTWQKIAWR